jgi:predicted AAA+ superfamily ATPase
MFEIPRIIESRIETGLSIQPAVAILGPRQVGKTTLVKHLQKNLSKQSIYFDLEKSSDLAKFQHGRIEFLENYQEKIVILDEIQRLPEIFPDLRGLIDKNRIPGRFILLGSASFKLLKNTSESLTGRIAYYEMTPLLLSELDPKDFISHWIKGGFPNAFLSHDMSFHQKWVEDFLSSYIERDLPLYGLYAEPIQVRRLLQMIAGIQGNLLNQTMLANSLGIKTYKVNNWLDYLENSFLIRRLLPYYTNIGKRLVKSPKLYIRDSGILHHLLSIFDYEALLGNAVAGGSWEGYLLEQIISVLKYNQLAFFYRTAEGAELDLIIEENLRIKLAIEFKLTNSPSLSKGNTEALKDLGHPPLLLITPSAEDYVIRKGVQVCSINTMYEHIGNILNNHL